MMDRWVYTLLSQFPNDDGIWPHQPLNSPPSPHLRQHLDPSRTPTTSNIQPPPNPSLTSPFPLHHPPTPSINHQPSPRFPFPFPPYHKANPLPLPTNHQIHQYNRPRTAHHHRGNHTRCTQTPIASRAPPPISQHARSQYHEHHVDGAAPEDGQADR